MLKPKAVKKNSIKDKSKGTIMTLVRLQMWTFLINAVKIINRTSIITRVVRQLQMITVKINKRNLML